MTLQEINKRYEDMEKDLRGYQDSLTHRMGREFGEHVRITEERTSNAVFHIDVMDKKQDAAIHMLQQAIQKMEEKFEDELDHIRARMRKHISVVTPTVEVDPHTSSVHESCLHELWKKHTQYRTKTCQPIHQKKQKKD